MSNTRVGTCPTHGHTLRSRRGKFGHFYSCPEYPNCDIIGSFSGFDHKFRISDQPTRAARMRAHEAFDQLWKRGHLKRTAAYKWLAAELGIKNAGRDCHIKHFDEETCRRVVVLSNAKIGAARILE